MKPFKSLIAAGSAAFLLSLYSFYPAPSKITLNKKWETDTLFRTPESVIFDKASNSIYVSNIDGKPWEKDGNGFISKISLDGKIVSLKFITGIDAPKGMGIYKGKIYIADINKVVIANLTTGTIDRTIEIAGALALNDITIDNAGRVYVSDSGGKKVFLIYNNTASTWIENDKWKRPNGVLASNNNLKLVDAEEGVFYEISYADKTTTTIAKGLTRGDGIVAIGKNEYLVSNWNGEINYVSHNGVVERILDTKDIKQNAADIWYIESNKLLIIPTFTANKVTAFEYNKN